MADGVANDPPGRALRLSIADPLEVRDSVTTSSVRSLHLHDHLTVTDEARPQLLKLGPAEVHASARLELTIRAVPQVEPAIPPPRQVDIGVTREAWLLGASTGLAGLSQVFAPGNALAGGLALAFGYAWAHWRWDQRH